MGRKDKVSVPMNGDLCPFVIKFIAHTKEGFCRMSAEM
jgi:hypothetical protein